MSLQALLPILAPFVTILFLLAVGAGMRRGGMVTAGGARQMSALVLNVSLPALIFSTLADEITPQELARAPLLVAMGGYALSAAIARLPFLRSEQRATFQTAVAVTNTGFVGYPVCLALLGNVGLLYAVLYDVGLTVVMSTYSIWLLSRASRRANGGWRGALLDLLRTPMMWGMLAGAAWGALGGPTPEWLMRPLRTLGQVTTPLALLTVGMLVQPARSPTTVPTEADAPARSRVRAGLAALALARLVLAPALIWALVAALRVERSAAAVIVLQTAMPSAVCTTAMVEQYGGDSAFASAGVISTTLLSLLTLPVWSGVLLG